MSKRFVALLLLGAACADPSGVERPARGIVVAVGTVLDSLGHGVRGADVYVGVTVRRSDGAGTDRCDWMGSGFLSLARGASGVDGSYQVTVPAADSAVAFPACVATIAVLRDTTASAGEPIVAGAVTLQTVPAPGGAEVAVALRLGASLVDDRGLDDEWARLARTAVPGWAGLTFDGCTLVALVTDPATQGDAARRYAAAFPIHNGACPPGPGPVAVRRVDYDFAQLRRWYDRVQPITWLDGWRSTDIDEARNRVVLEYATERALARAERALALLDVPPGAVLLRVGPGLGVGG